MSKPVTLATCIAKMYEGAKLDNSGAVSGTPKKASSTLMGSLGHIEKKIILLEGRVEQITNTQSLMLQKLESVCQGMGALEKNFEQLRQEKTLGQSFMKPLDRDQDMSDSAVISEVRSLCEETVALLMSLKQEGQRQRKKIEGIESSVSTLDKVFGYIGEVFRSSKIVEFILSGVVPWRKQGLLNTSEDEKNTSDDATKAKGSFCHTETQAPEEINEQPAVTYKHQEHKIKSPALISFPAVTTKVPVSKSQRRPKEVTLKSREPGRVQAFSPESPCESEAPEVSKDHKSAETLTVTAAPLLESKTPETHSALQQTNAPVVALLLSVDSLIKKEEPNQKGECEHKTKEVPKAKPCHAAKPDLPITANLEQKETAALESPQLREAEYEPRPELVTQKTNTETVHVVLENPETPQSKIKPSINVEVEGFVPESEADSKSTSLDLQFPIIDDCPPRPAPFEHRIVSAKQVPIGSYYSVEPNKLLGGVEGGELFDRIVNEEYQLTELDAIVFVRQICEGVQYLHQQYILHLDLKPENILCVSSNSNQIKIIDFGLARKYRPREKLKVNFGTPEFLAPEVVNYDFVSFPTDMWSVGVITYMLLSGLSPFLGENDAETMNNILHANWDFDAEAFENVSEEAKDFIAKLLIPAKCSRLSASGCMKHSWLNNLEEKAKQHRVRLKSQMRLQRYLAAHRQWKKHFYAVTAANRLKRFQQSRSISVL
ncbi:myosin light chain kinase 3 [Silurus asotus]|uniref:Myosin light chain kinase 3 n=1 Tax=Silurus asotus TaxID=30991 RepID=A0AAD5B181_SILAS|nr:myosin light chain kinase 3 [Silurus asotus]